MTERERGKKATQLAQDAGIDCVIDSVKPDTFTVLCGSGVMAYYDGKLLALGEHVPLTAEPVPLFITDVVNHRDAAVMV